MHSTFRFVNREFFFACSAVSWGRRDWETILNRTDFALKADAEGFIVAAPDGIYG
jgi:hypothetical protein